MANEFLPNNAASLGNGVFVLSTPPPLRDETNEADTGNLNGATSFTLTTGRGTRVDVKTLRDVVNEVPTEREWTVDGIAPDSGLVILGGRHKRGKSTLALHLSRCIESGEPFLDRDTKKAPVVYINFEMGPDYFVSLSNADPMPENFYVVNRPEPRLQPETIQAIIGAMKDRGFEKGIMVIDSFRGAFKLEADRENQAGAAGIILRLIQEIALSARWLIVVVHHHKKNTDGEGSDNLSGTGDFGAAADVIWTWSRPADPLRPGLLEIEGRLPPVDPIVVQLSPEECTYLGTFSPEGKRQEEEQRILEVVSKERLQGKEIETRTGIPYSTIQKRLASLKRNNLVDCERAPGRGSPQVWFARTA